MWWDLNLDDRAQRVLNLAAKHAIRYPVEAAALLCISLKESIYIEPLMMAYASCESRTTDQGLGQIVYSTFRDMVETFDFQSQIDPFNKPPYTSNSKLLFEAMALNVELQIEAMSAILAVKLRAAKGNYRKAFEFYNGGPEKRSYGQMVDECFQCMRANPQNKFGCIDKTDPYVRRMHESTIAKCRTSRKESGR